MPIEEKFIFCTLFIFIGISLTAAILGLPETTITEPMRYFKSQQLMPCSKGFTMAT